MVLDVIEVGADHKPVEPVVFVAPEPAAADHLRLADVDPRHEAVVGAKAGAVVLVVDREVPIAGVVLVANLPQGIAEVRDLFQREGITEALLCGPQLQRLEFVKNAQRLGLLDRRLRWIPAGVETPSL